MAISILNTKHYTTTIYKVYPQNGYDITTQATVLKRFLLDKTLLFLNNKT